MKRRDIRDIVMIGAGNVGRCLSLALKGNGMNILQVFNRSAEKGKKLAARTGSEWVGDTGAITPAADLYILAVSDTAIEELALHLRLKDQLVVHTSGTLPMDVLKPVSADIGVFYPLQTFSGVKRISLSDVPVCLEASTPEGTARLATLASTLTGNVHFMDSEKRKILHLAAVFSSNFTNFMNTIAEGLLQDSDIPFEMLKPLIRKTIRNIGQQPVFRNQTGPAVRGDERVLAAHRELLRDQPDYLAIYNMITDAIIKYRTSHAKL